MFVCVHFMLTLHFLVSVDYISHPSPINPAWSESPTVNSREYYQMFIEYVHTRVVNTTDTDTGVVRVREIQMSDDNQNWQKKKHFRSTCDANFQFF